MMTATTATAAAFNHHRQLESAVLSCHCAVYEEWLATPDDDNDDCETLRPKADLAIAFNAGVWGYREWKTTIEYMVQQKQSVPFVFTAYTLEEAEDDYDVIQQAVAEAASTDDNNNDRISACSCCSWEPEANPFSSREDRYTATAVPGRQYRENAAWQGWLL